MVELERGLRSRLQGPYEGRGAGVKRKGGRKARSYSAHVECGQPEIKPQFLGPKGPRNDNPVVRGVSLRRRRARKATRPNRSTRYCNRRAATYGWRKELGQQSLPL